MSAIPVLMTTEMTMIKKHSRRFLPIGAAAAAVALLAATALAAGPSDHTGEPAAWGPALEDLCDSPLDAAALGYHVIVDGEPDLDGSFGGLLEGTNAADAIFAGAGNDTVHSGAGNDLVCGGYGFDTLLGGIDNDAIFGQQHDGTLRGGGGEDYLQGGGQHDRCDGGNGDDAAGPGCDEVND